MNCLCFEFKFTKFRFSDALRQAHKNTKENKNLNLSVIKKKLKFKFKGRPEFFTAAATTANATAFFRKSSAYFAGTLYISIIG